MTERRGGLTPDDFDDVHDFIRVQVAAGYASIDEMVADAVEIFSETSVDPVAVAVAAHAIASTTVAAHADEQRGWVETTDCDRLDAAFAELESAGIVARQHFGCCATCGASEIAIAMEETQLLGRPARGFTFFHVQDTEHAVAGDGLYLSYGSADKDQAKAVAIGHEVVAVLGRHGLTPAWNGKLAHRIQLPLTWQRRRP